MDLACIQGMEVLGLKTPTYDHVESHCSQSMKAPYTEYLPHHQASSEPVR